MNKFLLLFSACFLLTDVEASWYWPFESSEEEPPRLSELVKKASETIEEASDLASDGKTSEAVEKYRQALVEISRIEWENPDLAKSAVMGTLKTKRAYVEATIDSLLMTQARENAKPVAVSDTTDLEQRLREEREEATAQTETVKKVSASAEKQKKQGGSRRKAAPKRPLTPCEDVMKALAEKDYDKADRLIKALLEAKPNDATALNLRAAMETAQEKFSDAEKTLDAAMRSNPRDYFAYYNMAVLKLQTRKDDRDGARRYYETGRALGGPVDLQIEDMLK